ncbi:MAG TPA: hypothetical protein DDW52_10775 [Planctomycetaceae bacterium]|nr:hypothetical protein [Planctomycetaceae bacterium]
MLSIAIIFGFSDLRRPRTGTIFRTAASFLLLLTAFKSNSICTRAAAQTDATLVEVAAAESRSLRAARRVVGTVQPVRSSTIGAGAAGRVEAFEASIGQPVKVGETLAQLRTETLEIERRAAEAELKLFQQQRIELENGSRPEEIAEAEAQAMAAKAAKENAARQLDRMLRLEEANAAIAADVEDARERAQATQFIYAASQATLKRVTQGPRVEQIAQAAARVELQEQQIALIDDRIKKHSIRAPFDGFVTEEFTQAGAWLNPGDPVVTVIDLRQIDIVAPAPAEVALGVQTGQEVRIEFPELPEKLLVGKVLRVVPRADGAARVFPVVVRLDNSIEANRPLLLGGMLARVHLPDGEPRKGTVVPKDALVLSARSRSIFVAQEIQPQDTRGVVRAIARKVNVELGLASENTYEIFGSVKQGDWIVVEGNERLVDGQAIEFRLPTSS